MQGLWEWLSQPVNWSFLSKPELIKMGFETLVAWVIPTFVVLIFFTPALIRWRKRSWLRESAKRDRIDISLTLWAADEDGLRLMKRPMVQFHLGDLFDFHEVQTLQDAISVSLKRPKNHPLTNLLIIDDEDLRYRIYSDIFTAINGTLSRAAYMEEMFPQGRRRTIERKWVKMALAFEPDAHSPQINILLLQSSLEDVLDNENLYFELNQETMRARLVSLRNVRDLWLQEDEAMVPEHKRIVRLVELAKLA